MKKTLSLLTLFIFVSSFSWATVITGDGTIINGLASDKLNNLVKMGGATFVKDYELLPVGEVTADQLNADFAMGSKTATFTSARSASAPATYVDASGNIQLVTTANTGRIQGGYYDSTGFHTVDSNGESAKGLMIEASGTNLQTNSQPLSSWYMKTVNVWANSGGTSIWQMYYSNGGASTNSIGSDSIFPYFMKAVVTNDGTASDTEDIRLADSGSGPSLANATTYTLSFWVWCDSVATLAWNMNGAGGPVNQTFNTVANTWIRITGTFTTTSAAASYFKLEFGNNGNITVGVADIQIEASPYATSFIPTTTASLTRPAEVLKYPIAGNRTASQESIFVKFATEWASTSGVISNLELTDTKNRQITTTAIPDIRARPNNTDNSSVVAIDTTSRALNTSTIISAVYQHISPYSEIYNNGISKGTYTGGDWTNPKWGTSFWIGQNSSGVNYLNGIIQSVAIYNRALSAGEVSTATGYLQN